MDLILHVCEGDATLKYAGIDLISIFVSSTHRVLASYYKPGLRKLKHLPGLNFWAFCYVFAYMYMRMSGTSLLIESSNSMILRAKPFVLVTTL